MSSSNKSGDQSAGPKVLRIGIVQRGKIIDERELKRRETVSIGTSEKATFTVSSDALPASFDLFEFDGSEYYIRFGPGMDGRIQLPDSKVSDVEALRRGGRLTKRGEHDAFKIDDKIRGKVVVGDVTVLFQFKAPAAAPLKPQLPPDIKGSLLQNIDAQFTAIFVLVAIFQISLVTYARSLPWVEPTSIEQIDATYQKLIMPDRAPEPPREMIAETEDKGDEAKKDEEKPKDQNKGTKKKDTGPVDQEAAARARAAAIKNKVAGTGLLKVLGASGSGGSDAISDVFAEGGGAIGDLGEAFSGIQGVDLATSGGQGGTRGGGAGVGVGIGDLGTSGGGSVNSGSKTEVAVRGSVQEQTPEVDGELSQAQISAVMKRQIKALRDCYERALKRDRGLAGKIIIRFEILESGKTANVEIEDTSLGSSDVKQCIAGRVKYWRFPKPDGGSVLVSYPLVFTPAS